MIGAASGIDAESGYYFDDTKRYIDANPALSDSAIYPCNVPLSLQEDFHNMMRTIRHILRAVLQDMQNFWFIIKEEEVMKRGTFRAILIFSIFAIGLTSQLAQAQLEEIVVTAQKRVESVQDVPIAIQAITGDDLERMGVSDAKDILNVLPNLSSNASNSLNSGFSIRGVGTNNFHGNVNQAVGIYQDEVSISTPFSGVLGVYDMERVEVLRGPQNSLFGRNTTGGAINYISRKPEIGAESNGFLSATAGSESQLDVTAAYGFSLGDKAAARISLQDIRRDGPFTNLASNNLGQELGERDRFSARAQLAYQPSDSTEILFNLHTAQNRGNNIGNRAFGTRDPSNPTLVINGAQDFRNPILPDDSASICSSIGSINPNGTGIPNCTDRNGFNPSTGEFDSLYNVSSARAHVDIDGGFIKLTHDFSNGMIFTSISGYDKTEVQNADEASGTNSLQFIPQQEGNYDQFSQELRLQSSADAAVRWVGGLYYYKEDLLLYTIARRFNFIGPNGNVPRDIAAHNILDQKDEDISIYGQIEIDLGELTTLTLGLRYTENDKKANSRFGVVANYNTNLPRGPRPALGNAFLTTQIPLDNVPLNTFIGADFIDGCYAGTNGSCSVLAPTISEFDLSQKLKEVGGKIGIDHKLTESALVYANYSRGFKSGGFDTRALASLFGDGAGEAFDEETLDSYEIGYKNDVNEYLQFNTAVFYYTWNDLQTFGVFNGQPQYVNIPESELTGLEAELKYAPSDSLYMQASIGLLDTKITDTGGLTAADVGHPLPNSPEITFNALISKDIRASNESFWTLQSDIRYVDDQVDSLQFSRDALSTKDSQFYLNARATYTFGSDQEYSVSFWGENLTDETYCADIGVQNPVSSADGGFTGIDLTSTIVCQPGNEGKALFGVSGNFRF